MYKVHVGSEVKNSTTHELQCGLRHTRSVRNQDVIRPPRVLASAMNGTSSDLQEIALRPLATIQLSQHSDLEGVNNKPGN